MKTTIINSFGKMAGWNSVTCRLFGRDVVGISKIAYDDEQDKENVYGAGKMPIGQSEGNYKAKASIELTLEERLAIQNSLPFGVRIQDIAPFPVIVAYEYGGRVYKDVLMNCSFKNNGVDVKQGDKTISTNFDLNISHINWNQ
jgi:hypothetical protein